MKGHLTSPPAVRETCSHFVHRLMGFYLGLPLVPRPEIPLFAVAGCPSHWGSQYWSKWKKKKPKSTHIHLCFLSLVRSDLGPTTNHLIWLQCFFLVWHLNRSLMSWHHPINSQACLRVAWGIPRRTSGTGVVPDRSSDFCLGRLPAASTTVPKILSLESRHFPRPVSVCEMGGGPACCLRSLRLCGQSGPAHLSNSRQSFTATPRWVAYLGPLKKPRVWQKRT